MSGILNPTPSAASSSDTVEVVAFDYTTASPLVLQAVASGQVLNRAVVVVTTPFDGVGSSVLLGTTASPGMVLGSGDVKTMIADQYESAVLFEFASSDILKLTITPAGSTQGAGFLFYRIKE